MGWRTTGEFKAEVGRSLKVQVGNTTLTAEWRQFSSGSYGWYYGGKVTIPTGGEMGELTAQLGVNMFVRGSKTKGFQLPPVGTAVDCVLSLNATVVKSGEWEDGGELPSWFEVSKSDE
jgi:hypothetical protein